MRHLRRTKSSLQQKSNPTGLNLLRRSTRTQNRNTKASNPPPPKQPKPSTSKKRKPHKLQRNWLKTYAEYEVKYGYYSSNASYSCCFDGCNEVLYSLKKIIKHTEDRHANQEPSMETRLGQSERARKYPDFKFLKSHSTVPLKSISKESYVASSSQSTVDSSSDSDDDDDNLSDSASNSSELNENADIVGLNNQPTTRLTTTIERVIESDEYESEADEMEVEPYSFDNTNHKFPTQSPNSSPQIIKFENVRISNDDDHHRRLEIDQSESKKCPLSASSKSISSSLTRRANTANQEAHYISANENITPTTTNNVVNASVGANTNDYSTDCSTSNQIRSTIEPVQRDITVNGTFQSSQVNFSTFNNMTSKIISKSINSQTNLTAPALVFATKSSITKSIMNHDADDGNNLSDDEEMQSDEDGDENENDLLMDGEVKYDNEADDEEFDDEEIEVNKVEDTNEADLLLEEEPAQRGDQSEGDQQSADERIDSASVDEGEDIASEDDDTVVDEEWEHEPQNQSSRKNGHKCQTCGKILSSPSCLKRHIRIHTGERPFKCSWKGCGRMFAHNVNMKKHYKTHSSKKSIKCSWMGCERTFATKAYMQNHCKIHTGEKPFKCLWVDCGQKFVLKSNMIAHQTTHTGIKIECIWEGCEKKFSRKSQMILHHKIHTGEKSFVCPWKDCGMNFARKTNMEVHQRTHNREKPFACSWDGCEKVFAHKCSLSLHLKTKHNSI